MQLLEPLDLADDALRAFGHAHGRPAEAVGRAPGRVNVIGEHTDYHGGLCLPIALEHATWTAVARRTDDLVRVRSTSVAEPWEGSWRDRPGGWPAYVLGTLAALGHRGGMDVLVHSTVPVGAGLSSSAALICSLAVAVSSSPPEELLPLCIAAETDQVGAPTGGLDQTVALLAAPGQALLLDFGDDSRRHVPWRPEEAGLELLVVDTRTRHSHAEGGYRRRREEAVAAVAAAEHARDTLQVRRHRHVRTENERVRRTVAALAVGDWPGVGRAMTASHRSLRDDYEVSSAELDAVVDTALASGALGARMTGGGFGGCAIVLAPRATRSRLLATVAEKFRDRGWEEPRALVARAGGPATRVRSGGSPRRDVRG